VDTYEIDHEALRNSKADKTRFSLSSTSIADDAALDTDVCLVEGDGTFYGEIRHDFGLFKVALSTSRDCTLSQSDKTIPLKIGKLEPKRIYHLEFMVYDGCSVVLIDGKV